MNYGELHCDLVHSGLVFSKDTSLLTEARISFLGNSFWISLTVFFFFLFFFFIFFYFFIYNTSTTYKMLLNTTYSAYTTYNTVLITFFT